MREGTILEPGAKEEWITHGIQYRYALRRLILLAHNTSAHLDSLSPSLRDASTHYNGDADYSFK